MHAPDLLSNDLNIINQKIDYSDENSCSFTYTHNAQEGIPDDSNADMPIYSICNKSLEMPPYSMCDDTLEMPPYSMCDEDLREDGTSTTDTISNEDHPINFSTTCGLNIACLNVRGILNKFDEVQRLLNECNFDIFGICETFLDDDVNSHEYTIDGYNVISNSRNRHGGGVLLYIKDSLKYVELKNVHRSDLESLWVQVKCKNISFALGMMYRPPSANIDYLNAIIEQIDHISAENENIMFMGDLNYNCLNEGRNPLSCIETLYDMRQLVTSPTRVTLSTSTLIDVIYTNFPDNHSFTGVYEISLSDHYLVYTVLSNLTSISNKAHREVRFRNYMSFIEQGFIDDLCSHPAIVDCNWSSTQLQSKWDNFKTAFLQISNKHAQFQVRRLKDRSSPWITQEIKNLMYRRDYLKRKSI